MTASGMMHPVAERERDETRERRQSRKRKNRREEEGKFGLSGGIGWLQPRERVDPP